MELNDYPSLFKSSDSSAINARRKHFIIVRLRILLLLVVAGITSYSWNSLPDVGIFVAIFLASLLAISIALTAIMEIKKYDRIWFSSRAIAESVKTETWRFMTKVRPYDGTVQNSRAENLFLAHLDEILHRQQLVCSELTKHMKSGTQVTDYMRKARSSDLENRRSHYAEYRVSYQRKWYSLRVEQNDTQGSRWFYVGWGLEISTVVIAITTVSFAFFLNLVGLFTTAAAGALSWAHARSYRELSQSYGLVAQELTLLEDRARHVSKEEELEEVVLDTERTISREHSMWLTRRLLPRA